MAFTATAVGRVRSGGNAANGTFFDAGISGAGTDYTDQDAAQATWTTSLSMAGTTTLTDSGSNNLFTSAMIGNAVKVGSLFYFITAYTNANSVTVDRSDTFTNQSGRVGGAAADPWTIINSASSTHGKVVPGNTVYIRGAGSDHPTSNDYTTTSYRGVVAGDTTDGRIKVIGENGRPRLASDGLMFIDTNGVDFENIYFSTTGASSPSYGIVGLGNNNVASTMKNCVVDTNGQAMIGIRLAYGGWLVYCEIWSGSTSPSASSANIGVESTGDLAGQIIGCRIHHMRGAGISAQGGTKIQNCIIHDNVGDGILMSNAPTQHIGSGIIANTIDGNGGHGISLTNSRQAEMIPIVNNILSNHTGSGKSGLNLSTGSTSLNDKLKSCVDHNAYYNNTANVTNISLGANSVALSADPYVDSSTFDFSLNSTAGGGADCKGAGLPLSFPGSDTVSVMDIGASQAAAGGGGGGGNTYSRGRIVNA